MKTIPESELWDVPMHHVIRQYGTGWRDSRIDLEEGLMLGLPDPAGKIARYRDMFKTLVHNQQKVVFCTDAFHSAFTSWKALKRAGMTLFEFVDASGALEDPAALKESAELAQWVEIGCEMLEELERHAPERFTYTDTYGTSTGTTYAGKLGLSGTISTTDTTGVTIMGGALGQGYFDP